MKRNVASGVFFLLILAAGCAPSAPPEPPDTRAADETAIRAAVAEWARKAEARDVEGFVSYYAPNAKLMLPGAPTAQGTEAIRALVEQMFATPGLDKLTFATTSVEVARCGDLAYEVGRYEMTVTDPKTKKTATEKGKYVCVWRKQADGSWKVLADIINADPA